MLRPLETQCVPSTAQSMPVVQCFIVVWIRKAGWDFDNYSEIDIRKIYDNDKVTVTLYDLPFLGVASGHVGMFIILRPTLCCSTGILCSKVMLEKWHQPATFIHKQDQSGRCEHITVRVFGSSATKGPETSGLGVLTIHGRSPNIWKNQHDQHIYAHANTHTHTHGCVYIH